ncbi:SGNH/GDSL hydrolase family protein [Lacihabitans lacunae]|uniref:SGNH/GDSL hydrolase family protein n=1 Tax=Lacihabitans lacunae TaxID=1028214 RepID=A0ABV7Z2C5_9BACT
MKYFLYLLLFSSLINCKNKVPQAQNDTPKQVGSNTYLALGDSYTIGESVAEADRWPVQLVRELKDKNISVDNPKIIAKTGWTTDELKAAIVSQNISQKYDLVSLLIGVNNQYRGRNMEEFKVEFEDLLNTAIAFSRNGESNVFVVSIPDWGVSPFAAGRDVNKIGKEIDAYNAASKVICDKYGIIYIDITDISRETQSGFFASDGLHPSGKMYAAWVNKIVSEVLKFKLND